MYEPLSNLKELAVKIAHKHTKTVEYDDLFIFVNNANLFKAVFFNGKKSLDKLGFEFQHNTNKISMLCDDVSYINESYLTYLYEQFKHYAE